MRCLPRVLLVVIALNVTSIGRADEPASGSNRRAWPALEWKMAAPSPFKRVESPTVVVNDKLYLFGGFTEDLQASKQIDIFDLASDSWSRKKDMPTGLTDLNPAIEGKTIWFVGGFQGKHPGPVVDEVWKYDVASDSWTVGIPLPEPRAGGGLAILGRQLHYFGGYKADRDTNAGEHWSLPLDEGTAWMREADLPDPRGHVRGCLKSRRRDGVGSLFHAAKSRFEPFWATSCGMKKTPDPFSDSL